MSGEYLLPDARRVSRRTPYLPAHVAARSAAPRLGLLRRNPAGMVGALILASLVLAAVAAPALAPYDPLAIDVTNSLASPSWVHLLGTDHLGRDMLSRLLYGGRTSLLAAGLVVAAVTLIGVAVGAVAGFFGGWLDEIIMRLVDILLAFPSFILALVVAGILGPGLPNVVLAMILVRWAGFARVVRSIVLSLREQPYIEAAASVGATDSRILLRHILPNVIGPITVMTTLDIGSAILGISGLSFIGLGVQLPGAEWGAMLNYARIYLPRAPQLMVYPGVAIALAVASANLLGDALRDILDPHQRHRVGQEW
jgi:peptide/nickel transport system permease protein